MAYKPNKQIYKKIKDKLDATLFKSGEVLEEKIKNNCPVDTGKLKKSIDTEKNNDLEIKIKAETSYAYFVEFGTRKTAPNPFFRSSIKESKQKMLEQFKNIIGK